MDSTKRRILVTGDFVVDHHIYEGRRYYSSDRRSRGVQEVVELGGAALVHHVLHQVKWLESSLTVAMNPEREVVGANGPIPGDLLAYAFWRPVRRKEKDPESAVWRATEAMGFGGTAGTTSTFQWPRAESDSTPSSDIVVISEGGMGFRSDPGLWLLEEMRAARWIVLKTVAPLVEGPLWELLSQPAFADRLLVIVTATELRKSTAQISVGLSWEETIESVLGALRPGGALASLARARHVVVAFESEGAVWIDRSTEDPTRQVHLVYEAAAAEGEARLASQCTSLGALSGLTAAVTCRLAKCPEHPDIELALEGGLSAMRDLSENGHGRAASTPAGFPAGRLARIVLDATCRYSRAVLPLSPAHGTASCCLGGSAAPRHGRCWSVLQAASCELGQQCPEPAWQVAELLVRRGPIALGSLPHLAIGGLISADRQEIEALRHLRRLILQYSDPHASGKKPLSIGVFGPPGAGKSFAVKEIAKTLLGEDGWMEFNLSQFKEGTDDLIGAFHQIRDRALKGILPIAFFDEFDSREYRWLQYLLAPMQDGAFQEGQVTHPIGKCILVFAGGTSRTFESFGPPEEDAEAHLRFRMAKGPDFKSRLDGVLDVLGPNQRELVTLTDDGKQYKRELDRCDIFFPIRRALILRSELRVSPVDKIEIDDGLLRAILRVKEYRHGARSLGKVVEPLREAKGGFLHRSLTPARNQLSLHVDANEFLALLNGPQTSTPAPIPLEPAIREVIAAAIHATYQELGRLPGWLKTEHEPGFTDLSTFDQNSNRAAADRVVTTLALAGLKLAPGLAGGDQEAVVRLRIEYLLEALAEAEHDGWMAWHLDQGWQWGPKTDKPKLIHQCLKPYGLLPDVEKNKDRNSARHYPDFARNANMHIAPVLSASVNTITPLPTTP